MTLVYHLYGRHFVTWSQEQSSTSNTHTTQKCSGETYALLTKKTTNIAIALMTTYGANYEVFKQKHLFKNCSVDIPKIHSTK